MKTNFTLLLVLFSLLLSGQTIFLEENFDNCTLPDGWSFYEEGDSQGWGIVTAADLNSDKQTFPSYNGNCFAGNNDSKWDDDQGSNDAVDDQIITPYLDLSSADDLVISFDYLSAYGSSIGIKLYYRSDDTEDWQFINNTVVHGGMISWQKKTIYPYGHVNAPMTTLQKPLQFMFKYSDLGFAKWLGVGIDNIKIYEPVSNDVVLADVMIPDVVPVGIIPVKAGLLNHGTNTIQSIKLKWQIDDGSIFQQTVNSFRISNGAAIGSALAYGSGTIPAEDMMVNFEEEGEFTLKVWLEYIGSTVDDLPDNNYWEKTVTVVNNLPEKQYIYEKYSHHTCSPCYESDLLAKQISEDNENIHVVSLHQAESDPMDYPEARELDISYSQRTHPSTLMDRRFLGHWEHGMMSSLYERLPLFATTWWSPAEVYFTKKIVDESIQTVELEIAGKFVADRNVEYRFNIWTIEDGVINYQAGAPEGNNYVHDHVLRNYTGGNYGQEGSLPEQIIAGEEYKYEATVNVDQSWDMENLTFIAVIQRYELDSDQREIVNASVIHINDQIVVSQDELEEINLKIYPNPSSDFIHVVLPEANKKVSYSIYNNVGQQVAQQNLQTHAQNYIQLDVRNYAVGNYIIMLEIDGTKVVKNFVVSK